MLVWFPKVKMVRPGRDSEADVYATLRPRSARPHQGESARPHALRHPELESHLVGEGARAQEESSNPLRYRFCRDSYDV